MDMILIKAVKMISIFPSRAAWKRVIKIFEGVIENHMGIAVFLISLLMLWIWTVMSLDIDNIWLSTSKTMFDNSVSSPISIGCDISCRMWVPWTLFVIFHNAYTCWTWMFEVKIFTSIWRNKWQQSDQVCQDVWMSLQPRSIYHVSSSGKTSSVNGT